MRLRIPRKQKFNAKPTIYRGRKYDSRAEAKYASELDMLKSSGFIHLWIRQPAFDLGEDTRYRADFLVIESSGEFYAVDVKGMETPAWKKIRILWEKYGEMPLRIIKNGSVSYTLNQRKQI